MNPLVSIVVPVYKVEKTLHNCIDSILKQTYKKFELLLIDDGSPDRSGEICDEYAEKDKRIKVIHKQNEGVSSARNTGFDNATGEYIVCVDSDDYVNECYLQDFIDVINKYPDVEILWCRYNQTDSFEKYTNSSGENDFKITISSLNEIMKWHEQVLDAAPWNKFYRKEIIDKNHLRMDTSISLGEDLLFNFIYMDVCSNKKIYIINKENYNYVVGNGESLNSKFYPDMFKIYKYIDSQLYALLIKWQIDSEQMKMYYNSVYYSYIRSLNNTFAPKSTYSKKERYQYNNRILKSKEFKTAVKNSNCHIFLIEKLAYRTNSYWIVKKCMNIIKFLSDVKNGRINKGRM